MKRDDAVTVDLLSLVSVLVNPDEVAGWTDGQVDEAESWASAAYTEASDNDDIEVPPKPDFLPGEAPWSATT